MFGVIAVSSLFMMLLFALVIIRLLKQLLMKLLYSDSNVVTVTRNKIYKNKKVPFLYNKNIKTEFQLDNSDIEYYNVPKHQNTIKTTNLNNFAFDNDVALDPDSQNVHESSVQRTLMKQYNTFSNNQTKNSKKDLITQIKKHIDDSNQDSDKKDICYRVLDQIQNRDASLTNFDGHTEVQILQKTWEAGDENVKEYLIQQLLDSSNGDSIYCPTGVASRIVNASFVNEPEKMPKTKELIHEEMMQTAANLRSELEQDAVYTELNDTEQQEKLKEAILIKYKEDYTDTGILNETEVDDMTKDWIEYI